MEHQSAAFYTAKLRSGHKWEDACMSFVQVRRCMHHQMMQMGRCMHFLCSGQKMHARPLFRSVDCGQHICVERCRRGGRSGPLSATEDSIASTKEHHTIMHTCHVMFFCTAGGRHRWRPQAFICSKQRPWQLLSLVVHGHASIRGGSQQCRLGLLRVALCCQKVGVFPMCWCSLFGHTLLCCAGCCCSAGSAL